MKLVSPVGMAELSACGAYRYSLTREWSDTGSVTFIMLNPSTADASKDDPTIRKCIGFAKRWGMGRIEVVNLFAFRATDPRQLSVVEDPVGYMNDSHIAASIDRAALVVVAWGAHPRAQQRVNAVVRLATRPLHALGVTKDGHPRHPLYVPYEVERVSWPVSAKALGS